MDKDKEELIGLEIDEFEEVIPIKPIQEKTKELKKKKNICIVTNNIKPQNKSNEINSNKQVELENELEHICDSENANNESLEINHNEENAKKAQDFKIKSKTTKNKKPFKVIPLGGLEQIGMNITAFEYNDTIIVVDCGIAFPDEATQPGIEAIIPNITYLRNNIEKVKAFVVTHGHEDHIGAFPYILKNLNVPIYGTPLTIGLIKKKLEETYLLDMATLEVANYGKKIDFGDIQVEFIKTNHSIVDAAALAISTKIGTIIHTGDFKVDYTPVYDDAIDLAKFANLGEKGVLAVMCDSTNAERIGFTPSEKFVGPIIDSVFDKYSKSRIIVATFASNVDRVQQIINSANKHNRKVVLEGRSMVSIVSVAQELGKIQIPDKVLITEDEMKNFKDEQLCIIATGSQGENMAALSRMANKTHRKIEITSNDAIIFSSHPIPGNEKSISAIINSLEMQGAEVVFQDTHVSGHACQEEIKLIYSLTKPKYSIPIHGEYKHRLAGGKIAIETGIPKENVIMLQSGMVLNFYKDLSYKITDKVENGMVLIDAYSKEPISELVVKDRTKLAESGIVNVIFAIEKESRIYLNDVQIMSRGFVKNTDSQELLNTIKEQSLKFLAKESENGFIPEDFSTSTVKHKIMDYIFTICRKRPMVIVTIMEISL